MHHKKGQIRFLKERTVFLNESLATKVNKTPIKPQSFQYYEYLRKKYKNNQKFVRSKKRVSKNSLFYKKSLGQRDAEPTEVSFTEYALEKLYSKAFEARLAEEMHTKIKRSVANLMQIKFK